MLCKVTPGCLGECCTPPLGYVNVQHVQGGWEQTERMRVPIEQTDTVKDTVQKVLDWVGQTRGKAVVA